MSLSSMLDKTATLERPTNGVSTTGAPTSTGFLTVTGKSSMACAIWPNASNPLNQFAKFTIKGDYVFAFTTNPTAAPGDRLTVGTTHYLVQAAQTFSWTPIPETLYIVGAVLWL